MLANRRSGMGWSFDQMQRAMDRTWDVEGTDLTYQFCQNVEDGVDKARRAMDAGIETMLVVGGDGTVNTVARALIGTDVALGIVPVGSGNGFARHFEIPLSPDKAVNALASGTERTIDVGQVEDQPFLVTCSMAWEAALTESFQKSPFRGIVPYIFAGMQELIDYTPQDITVKLDGEQELTFKEPMIFTIANLSQYGGGAKIAPHAEPDDGCLELVVVLRQDIPRLIANLARLFDGSLDRMPQVATHRFREMEVIRQYPSPIQIDGEVVDCGERVHVNVRPACLKVLVPA